MSQASEQLEDTEDLNLDGIVDDFEETEVEDEREEGADDEDSHEREDNDEAEPKKPADDDPELEGEHGGEKVKLKKSELFAGYMKDADYRRKTAETAEQRRQAETLLQAVSQERQQYVTQLTNIMQVLQSDMQDDQAELSQLAQTDPAAYIARLQQTNARAQKYQQAEAARQALLKQEQEQVQRTRSEYERRERQTLIEKLPAWRDEKRASAEKKVIADYLIGRGFTPQDLNSLTDHRMLLLARDAALYHARKSVPQKQSTQHRAPVKPGAATRTTGREADAQRAADRLKRNPNSIDALAGLVAALE